jgi:hypothetical protein
MVAPDAAVQACCGLVYGKNRYLFFGHSYLQVSSILLVDSAFDGALFLVVMQLGRSILLLLKNASAGIIIKVTRFMYNQTKPVYTVGK